ncbi:hypothetical protein [Chryseobacterium sp.]|uniref:hypothetical protein n=1 Tax=Chryseobacterium sp. TaxID=1871047 RepID=UPI0011C7F744|nr:hypothetical protein [Chryseobacterium sp.]TXF77186.1 hypothetical protein FUA25_04405 [Chryseobacterium sp.]
MQNDKSQKKYNEILRGLKEEKMDWNFEDFLAKAENTDVKSPEVSGKKGASFPKIFLMAASLVLLVSLGMVFKFFNGPTHSEQSLLVENEIKKQKNDFENSNIIAAVQTEDSVTVASDSLVSDSAISGNNEDVLDKILPKRGRLKKQVRPHFVQNSAPLKSAPVRNVSNSDYESDYVIINGQKIESEQEAIDLTKYSFRILSENVSKTVAQTDALNNLNMDY